jgi:hypothetical protein
MTADKSDIEVESSSRWSEKSIKDRNAEISVVNSTRGPGNVGHRMVA